MVDTIYNPIFAAMWRWRRKKKKIPIDKYGLRFYRNVVAEFNIRGFKVLKENEKSCEIDLETGEHIHILKKRIDNTIYVFYSKGDKLTHVYRSKSKNFHLAAYNFIRYHEKRDLENVLKNDYEARI